MKKSKKLRPHVLYPVQVKDLGSLKRKLLYKLPDDTWIPAKVLESGFTVSPNGAGYKKEKDCQRACDIANRYNGYTKDEADQIIHASMQNSTKGKRVSEIATYHASNLRPSGKRNIAEWEAYGIAVAEATIAEYNKERRGKAIEPVQLPHTFIRVDNVLTVIDVPKRDVLPSTLKILASRYVTYKDIEGTLQEHLINVPTAAEDYNVAEFKPKSKFHRSVKSDIKFLSELCGANDAWYVRFI